MVLLSGGLDSATVLAIARKQGYICHAITFDYGQRHRIELAAARRVAADLCAASHRSIRMDLGPLLDVGDLAQMESAVGGSALLGPLAVPKDRDQAQMTGVIPVTYVPARNTIFLAYALALAEVIGSSHIFIGANAVDYSGYPDCRPQYLSAFEDMANLATKAAVSGRKLTLHAPLIDWPKIRIIEEGLKLGVDYGLTHSCYDPDADGRCCRRCDACLLRQRAFAQLGMTDPLWTVPTTGTAGCQESSPSDRSTS